MFLFFFTYGHLYALPEGKRCWVFLMAGTSSCPLWLVLWMIVLWLIIQRTKTLNPPILLIHFGFAGKQALSQIGWKIIARLRQLEEPATMNSSSILRNADVYYIILDSYSRQDALLKYHHLNTSSFVSDLEEMGFVFPACTQSNYSITALSLASYLNMNYVDKVAPEIVQQNLD